MTEVQDSVLAQVLLYVVFGGGAIAASYLLMEKVKSLAEISNSWYKRLVSYGIASVIGVASYLVLMWLGVTSVPNTPQEWVASIGSVAIIATGAQLVHGQQKLPRE